MESNALETNNQIEEVEVEVESFDAFRASKGLLH